MLFLKINYDDSKPALERIDMPDPDDVRSWLDACHEHLDCSCIEIAHTRLSNIVLVIDDCGKMRDDWMSRINTVASILYGSLNDPIVGNAILARRFGPDLLPMTEKDVDNLENIFGV